jgi:hypothetical protein
MKRAAMTAAAALLAGLAACSGAPDEGGGDRTSSEGQAICGNGRYPGCGPCEPNASSPTGYGRTCWTCSGSYVSECSKPAVLVPCNLSAYASPTTVSRTQDASTVHYSATVPSGCALEGSFSAYQNGHAWINNDDLTPPGNGDGWETLLGLKATTITYTG